MDQEPNVPGGTTIDGHNSEVSCGYMITRLLKLGVPFECHYQKTVIGPMTN